MRYSAVQTKKKKKSIEINFGNELIFVIFYQQKRGSLLFKYLIYDMDFIKTVCSFCPYLR